MDWESMGDHHWVRLAYKAGTWVVNPREVYEVPGNLYKFSDQISQSMFYPLFEWISNNL